MSPYRLATRGDEARPGRLASMAIRVMVGVIIVVFGGLSSCGPAHRGEPTGPRVRPDTVAEARGERLFFQYCSKCHPGGSGGLGPSLNDKPLPELAIRTQIRKGVGAMPSFDDHVLRDDDVAAIATYVQELRATPAKPNADARTQHATR